MVLYCIENNKSIDDMTMDEFKSFSDKIQEDVYTEISLEKCVSGRKLVGGPARETEEKAIENAKSFINSLV